MGNYNEINYVKVQGQVVGGSIVCVHHYSVHRFHGFSESGKIKNLALESHPTEKAEDPFNEGTKDVRPVSSFLHFHVDFGGSVNILQSSRLVPSPLDWRPASGKAWI